MAIKMKKSNKHKNIKHKFKLISISVVSVLIVLLILLGIYFTYNKNSQTRVFFRDDDPTNITNELLLMNEIFVKESVPISYQIIPNKLNIEFIDWIKDQKQENPNIISIGQHGYSHTDYGCSEFGKCRTYSQQYDDIKNGKYIMETNFGNDFSYVFTPPHNIYDEDTIKALQNNNFTILSASVSHKYSKMLFYGFGQIFHIKEYLSKRVSYNGKTIPGYDVEEYSVCVDILKTDDMNQSETYYESYTVKSYEEMVDNYYECKKRHKVVGIMIHDWALDSPDEMATFEKFVVFIKNQPDTQIVRIEELYSKHNK
jgi:hypothetical protein